MHTQQTHTYMQSMFLDIFHTSFRTVRDSVYIPAPKHSLLTYIHTYIHTYSPSFLEYSTLLHTERDPMSIPAFTRSFLNNEPNAPEVMVMHACILYACIHAHACIHINKEIHAHACMHTYGCLPTFTHPFTRPFTHPFLNDEPNFPQLTVLGILGLRCAFPLGQKCRRL
jgi:hypothetical protein